jgi:hypothetical protein
MDITDSNLSADAIHSFIVEREKRKAEESRKHAEAAKAEREKLHDVFLKDDVPEDAMGRVALMVRKAVEMGEKQALLFQFPSDWLPDQGRSITNHAADWHEHLDGFARRAHAYFERELKPRGFQLSADILDWPNGMPGDVGFFLRWKQPQAL